MATKKEIELKGETMEKSPVFAGEEKELLKKIVLLETENALLPQLKEEVALLKKELLSVKKSNEEITANEHSVRKFLEQSQAEVIALKKANETLKLFELQNKDLTKTRDQLTQEVFDGKKQIENLKINNEAQKRNDEAVLKEKIKILESLSERYNELAKLFDEYMKGSDDMIELSKVFLRNSLRTQELLQNKIKAFNGDGGNKK